ncbi:MAG: hypothetical protein EB027_01975, partial [Actinobacteria bacterium]|nr:hypothetical protein [Actinomycetota bacterium]
VVSARNAFQATSNHVKLNSDGSLVAYTGWCQTPPAGVCKLRILPDGLQTLSDIDVLRYIASYPELIESLGADIAKGRVHYEQTGAREGRRITFDPATYVASHPDLINSIGVNEEQATRHYITTGYRERRSASSFDALRYIASHGDVLTTFGFDTYSATKNYILYGYQDGRRITFDGLAYIASYGDLIDSIKTDVVAGIQHFIRYGFAEGRRVTFDALAYIASTGERIARFGTDVVAAARYYIEVGFKAGEKVTFSALAYLANNADLRTRFNGDLAAATQHFISTGFAEKRSASVFPNSPLTRLEAHRFLIQTTFGPTDADIKRLLEYGYAPNGYERWIDAEIAKPVSLMLPALIALVPPDTQGMGASIMQQDRVDLWFRKVMREDDQLRQRVAWALSQIMVVSDNGALLEFPFAIADFQDILSSDARQRSIVREELAEIVARYGDERRTKLVQAEGEFVEEDLIEQQDIVVTITRDGYIKRTRADLYRAQRRGGKGIKGAALKQDDVVEHFLVTTTHHWLLFFTTNGQVYRAKGYELPEAGRDARGQHVANLLAFQPGEQICQVLAIENYAQSQYLVLATRGGQVKKTALSAYDVNRTKLIAITLREDDEVIGAALINEDDDLMLVSRKGMSVRFNANDATVRPMGRPAGGVIGMRFRGDDDLLSMQVVRPDSFLVTVTDGGFAKRTSVEEWNPKGRGTLGVRAMRLVEARGSLVGALIMTMGDEIFAIASNGIVIRTDMDGIRATGRDTMGVALMGVGEAQVVAIARGEADDESDSDAAGTDGAGVGAGDAAAVPSAAGTTVDSDAFNALDAATSVEVADSADTGDSGMSSSSGEES